MKSSADVYILNQPTQNSWLLSFPIVVVATAMQMALAQQDGCHNCVCCKSDLE
jgi:hypothetical protein